ncbi:MAG TPA: type 4a pilus biogenesis protein PilO [Myxococcota bacterium]|nr:type 4a pilus biogenesis protein PilO [Myxococcota bacterium]
MKIRHNDSDARMVPKSVMALIYMAILTGIFTGYYLLVYRQQDCELAKMAKQKADLERRLDELSEIISQKSKFRSKIGFMRAKTQQNQKIFPDREDPNLLPELLKEIAMDHGLSNARFESYKTKVTSGYVEIAIQFEAQGSISSIADFFKQVCSVERYILVKNVEMSKPEIIEGKIFMKVNGYLLAFSID